MKTLLLGLAVLGFTAACSEKSPQAELNQQKEEARMDYRKDVQEAAQDKNEAVEGARDEFQDAQKEEAIDYVDESDSVDLDRQENRINIEESEDQMRGE